MKRLAFTLVLFSLLAFVPVFAAAAAPPVKLLLARGSNSDFSPNLFGYIEVANLGSNKQVSLVYQMDNGEWRELPATYHAPTHDNLEAWFFRTPNYTPSTLRSIPIRFALKYTVNGVTYWDNNGGWIVRNSWGTGWLSNGYGVVYYGEPLSNDKDKQGFGDLAMDAWSVKGVYHG